MDNNVCYKVGVLQSLLIHIILFFSILMGCSSPSPKLPYLGNPEIVGGDTIYPSVSSFQFVDQDSMRVTEKTFENKIYIADFIFLSCPTICPTMSIEMKKVYSKFKQNKNVAFLSHTIDPERDSIPRLKEYSNHLKINSSKWHIVTGNKKDIYSIAEKSYYSIAYPDSSEPGGFVHSGGILLIDKQKHIRGVYDGTNPKETDLLIKNIELLLKEN